MQFFTSSDGARIAYWVQGSGRPLVLLHGLMAHSGFFDRQHALAADFRLISIDLRGHGRSKAAHETLTVERLATDVTELVDALGLNGAIGVGWSLGASVLWRVLTGPASPRFAGAVIVDMTPRVLNDGDWTLGLSSEHVDARAQAIDEDFESFAVAAGGAIFAQPLAGEKRPLADWAGREFARNDAQAIGALWRSLASEDLRPLLGQIRQPTLVVHGTHSHLYGSDTAAHLVEALPAARALPFERSGHAPHMEQPEQFNAAVCQFAATLPPVLQPQTTE